MAEMERFCLATSRLRTSQIGLLTRSPSLLPPPTALAAQLAERIPSRRRSCSNLLVFSNRKSHPIGWLFCWRRWSITSHVLSVITRPIFSGHIGCRSFRMMFFVEYCIRGALPLMYTTPILICVIRIIHPNHEHCNTFPTIVEIFFRRLLVGNFKLIQLMFTWDLTIITHPDSIKTICF